ncbi:MAG: hypothetical protein VYC39_07760 [Myxococcota bacterium]|nr:hypothetical protein [Myxococcota bacterium]
MIKPLTMRINAALRPAIRQKSVDTSAGHETVFRTEVEQHLTNNRSGQAYLSTDTHKELGRRHEENVHQLGRLDPVSEAKYLVTMASLNYDGQARLAASMHTTQQAVSKIYRAHEYGADYARDLEKLLRDTEPGSDQRKKALIDLNEQFNRNVHAQ